MWSGPQGLPRGKDNEVTRQVPHPVCVWARPGASGLPLHASSPLHLTPLDLVRLSSPGRRTPPVSPGDSGAPGTEAHLGSMTDPDSSGGQGADQGDGGRITHLLSFSTSRLPNGPFFEPAALTLAWASGWTLSVAMARAGSLEPHEERGVGTGKGKRKQRAQSARPSWVEGSGAKEGGGDMPKREEGRRAVGGRLRRGSP